MSARRWFVGMMIVATAMVPTIWAMGAEHGGKEHGGKEHAGQAQEGSVTQAAAPSAAAPSQAAAPATITQEHGGKEHGGQTAQQAEPSAEQLRQTIRDYIASIEQEEGAFTIEDEATGTVRTLTLVQVHERVGKTGDAYYSCTDMTDTATGELLDLDFDVTDEDGMLDVADVRIHKVNGQARYTYDEQDNRIPLI